MIYKLFEPNQICQICYCITFAALTAADGSAAGRRRDAQGSHAKNQILDHTAWQHDELADKRRVDSSSRAHFTAQARKPTAVSRAAHLTDCAGCGGLHERVAGKISRAIKEHVSHTLERAKRLDCSSHSMCHALYLPVGGRRESASEWEQKYHALAKSILESNKTHLPQVCGHAQVSNRGFINAGLETQPPIPPSPSLPCSLPRASSSTPLSDWHADRGGRRRAGGGAAMGGEVQGRI